MRPRPLGLAFLSVVIAACDGGAPASTAPSPTTSASTELVADVDVGGRTMHLVCVGPTDTGEPTILLEAGGGGDYLTWAEILPEMRSTHRLCAYDRAGLGQSEPPPEASRTAADQVADLRALLDAAGVSGPFVIGAHSDGATVATLFTLAYPNDVVGLLFVDPRGPRVSARWREALPAPAADEPASVTDFRDGLVTFETDPSLNPEHIHLRTSFAEAAEALDAPGPLFGDRPVVVLSADDAGSPVGIAAQPRGDDRRSLGRRPAGVRGRVDRRLARDGARRWTRDPGRSAAGGDRRAREDPRRLGDLVAIRHGSSLIG